MRYVLFAFSAFLVFSLAAFSATIHVPGDQPTIQAGIDVAVNGDTVLVAPGTYVEYIDFKGKAITVTSSGGALVTTIDGNQKGSVVLFQNWEGAGSVLDGFTVTNGNVKSGGGIFCNNSASPIIMNNIITGNKAELGAGIFMNGSYSVITGNTICGNGEVDYPNTGGGIYVGSKSDPTIENNILYNNAAYGGGGIAVLGSIATITNNTICDNQSQKKGAGIWFQSAAGAILTNTIVRDNVAAFDPDISVDGTAPPVTYCNIEGGWLGKGNIDKDPLFVDQANGDYHLTFPSPSKDMGDNSAVNEPVDFEGDPRIAYGTVDMGADEYYTHLYWTGNATPGGAVQIKFVGLPGSFVYLWLGSGVLDPPLKSKWGYWYLQFPLIIQLGLGAMPSPDGVMVLQFTLPPDTPVPLTLPLQAGIKKELTNLSLMDIQ